MPEKHRVLIVGGGPAGMMAAAAAAGCGAEVCLIEKNEKLGKKLYITGKGRCNVTNSSDITEFYGNVLSNNKFLYSAFSDFDNSALMDWLEKAGCHLKVERGNRVFPVSDHASDVTAAMVRELKKRGVEILLNTQVKGLIVSKDSDEAAAGQALIEGVELSGGKIVKTDNVIVCTGGLSYPSTGSTGDGYRFGKVSGHRVIDPAPSLVPLVVREAWCRELMGLSLKNVNLTLREGAKVVYKGFGELIFTHFGVSGPLALTASAYYGRGKNKTDGAALLSLDLKPAISPEQLDRRLLREFEDNRNRQFKNALDELFPTKLIPVMVARSGIAPEKKVNEITRQERKGLAELIKNFEMTVTGTGGFAEAVVTRGGISVKDVDPSTMESKKVRGLYFAGEVLDLDALTGGYNLQIAWSTGHLAGKSAGIKAR